MMYRFKALALVAALLLPISASAAEQAVRKLEFVMAHKPENVENVKLIEKFADRVRERTHGELDISVFAPSAYSPDFQQALDEVYLGKTAMSQIAIKYFLPISQDLDVLDMPMLFKSHEHAAKVLDGRIGQDLRQSVYDGSNGRVRGLSFTYSGGFRDVYSTKDIHSVAELKGQKMRLRGGRFSLDAMDQLGLQYVYTPLYDDAGWAKMHSTGDIQAEEAEVNRIATYKYRHPEVAKSIKTVLETHHSLYLTMIVFNGPMFASLTPDQQNIVQEEAQTLALQERALSIQQEQDSKAQMAAEGVKFVSMSPADRQELEQMGNRVQAKYHHTLGKWIDAIKAAEPLSKVQESKVEKLSPKPL
ncbi:MAG: hypothetical protein GC134_08405 [Proteobacteria bacterium]|nr:hypothetical protein [Pseudomonadota bacterium]